MLSAVSEFTSRGLPTSRVSAPHAPQNHDDPPLSRDCLTLPLRRSRRSRSASSSSRSTCGSRSGTSRRGWTPSAASSTRRTRTSFAFRRGGRAATIQFACVVETRERTSALVALGIQAACAARLRIIWLSPHRTAAGGDSGELGHLQAGAVVRALRLLRAAVQVTQKAWRGPRLHHALFA